GRPLFNTNVLHELFDKHTHETPDLDPLPRAEQRVLLKALAKKPDHRYPSCLEFAKALREAVLKPPRRPEPWWKSALLIAAAVLACCLALGGLSMLLPKKIDLVGVPGWTAEGDTTVIGTRTYPRRFTRTVAGEQLVAILIPPTKLSDPPPFYLLENKFPNQVFKPVWESGPPPVPLGTFDPKYPEVWRKGASVARRKENWKEGDPVEVIDLGIDGNQEGVPVVGVT